MNVEIARHALDRVPITLIIDDSAPLVNLNYFFIRDRNKDTGENRRWEDIPVAIPESFTREWGEWCRDNGVKGKFSVIPCPAGLGRIDQGLPLFNDRQLESWLAMCREVIAPTFDITPEMMTHTYVVDPDTLEPLEPRLWEQYEWEALPTDREEFVTRYIQLACEILVNVGLTPQGVTSPGGFGCRSVDFYAKVAGRAMREVTDIPTPYFFCGAGEGLPVWYPDRRRGEATPQIISNVGDWTGSWTGYDPVSVDKYITADLERGRIPELIDSGEAAVLCSHWQGFYGMHDDDRRGFNTLKAVVRRLQQRDPHGEKSVWRRVSEITDYACSRQMASITQRDGVIALDLPVRVPGFTLKLAEEDVRSVTVDGSPLRRACSRRNFVSGTFYTEGEVTWVAFDPMQRECEVALKTGADVGGSS